VTTPRAAASALALAALCAAPVTLTSQGRGFNRGGGGSSTSRVASPTVVGSWMSHESWSDGVTTKTTLLVLWRGKPGWFSKSSSSGSSGGGGASTGSQHLSYGGLNLDIEFDYDKSIAKILGQDISLAENNVVLVDFVDAPGGATVVDRRWVAAAAPDQPSGPDAIAAIIKRTPELFDYLQCDAPLGDAAMSAMMRLICGQMRPD
jgi:hypothetical protein